MGLEVATYIHQLDAANPVGGVDQKQQGDDHLRLIKSTIQNTLPNVAGAVTATHTDLSNTSNLNSGTFTGSMTANVNCSAVNAFTLHYMRVKDIVHISGAIDLNVAGVGNVIFTMGTLPGTPTFENEADACGILVSANGSHDAGHIVGSLPSSVQFTYAASVAGLQRILFSCQYKV